MARIACAARLLFDLILHFRHFDLLHRDRGRSKLAYHFLQIWAEHVQMNLPGAVRRYGKAIRSSGVPYGLLDGIF